MPEQEVMRQLANVAQAVSALSSKVDESHRSLTADIQEVTHEVEKVTRVISGDLERPGIRDRIERIERDLESHRRRHSPPRGMPSVAEGTLQAVRTAESDEIVVTRWKAIATIGVALVGLFGTVIAGLLGLLK